MKVKQKWKGEDGGQSDGKEEGGKEVRKKGRRKKEKEMNYMIKSANKIHICHTINISQQLSPMLLTVNDRATSSHLTTE